jgi:hypothetical protein
MFKHARLGVSALAFLLACGCARAPGDQAAEHGAQALATPAIAHAQSVRGPVAPHLQRAVFARLPDRGELVRYAQDSTRREGAYTWHRADVSEAHALHAIADGHLRVVTPSGVPLDFAYDRHVEHGSGDWTWVGHRPGHPEQQAILTFGEQAAFGSIAQPDALPLRLTVRNGASWLVETDPQKVAALDTAATRPRRPDFRVPPRRVSPAAETSVPGSGMTAESAPAMASATTSGTTTIDLVIGYTTGFASDHGGTSGAVTRLNYLVDLANTIYRNSKLNAVVRLVATVPVSYTDATSNDSALEAVTGYDSNANQPVAPDPAFNARRSARETYGADLVSVVRSYRDPENDGCGVAWLIGGGQSGISSSDAAFAYSVVSDGDDGGYYCLDEALAHEMGHNMGAAHDVATAKGDDGTLDAGDYGAFPYSFGFKSSTYGFYTVMAYGDAGQRIYDTFSSPGSTFCGGHACGTSQADNARTLAQTMPTVATFRATAVADDPQAASRVLLRQVDTNGNGDSDLLLFNHGINRLVTWFMAGTTRQAYNANSVSGALTLVDAADFDGNGRTDLLFENRSRHQLVIALSTGVQYALHTLPYAYGSSQVAIAAADVNGNGMADILLRDRNTGRVTTWFMSGATRTAYNSHAMSPGYAFVGWGDLNGDHRQDLLWTDASHNLMLSTSTGVGFDNQVLGLRYGSTYQVAGLQDINGDGSADILLTRNDHKLLVVWYMNGASRAAYNSRATDPAYRLVGRADMDGNGKGDLVLSNPTTRQIKVMFSSGVSFSTSLLAYVPASGYQLMDVP